MKTEVKLPRELGGGQEREWQWIMEGTFTTYNRDLYEMPLCHMEPCTMNIHNEN